MPEHLHESPSVPFHAPPPHKSSSLQQQDRSSSDTQSLQLSTVTPDLYPEAPPGTPVQTESPQDTERLTPTLPSQSRLEINEKSESRSLHTPRSKPKHPRRKLVSFRKLHLPKKIFENRGSTARDHLASERTYLAYVRTSLALASTGVALVQLFTIADLTSKGLNTPLTAVSKRVQKFARPLGVTTVLLSLIVLCIAFSRYFTIQSALPNNQFPVARFSIVFITFVLAAVVVVVFGALLGGRV
ncbi:hypothetical protein CPB83DRAFT_907229 [Crepidotus variabilis]|uniref:DUF202 domain-containing protein n=1 Tax=Crepidotus variabilis TaxID=179855 RepID=A0A9P6JPR5_9AGAR|nr:hypothetical protein CPB83DRAFT_907229 [Crepidotus variabilis]